jgi:hypothetical protein
MKKSAFFMVALLWAALAQAQAPAREEAMSFFVASKNVNCELATNTENCTVYYEILLQNRTRQRADSVFGSFFVEKDGKNLAIVDFECYQAMSPQGIAMVVKPVRYNFLRKDVYTLREIESVASWEKMNRELLDTDLKKLQITLHYLQVNYQGGKMAEYNE